MRMDRRAGLLAAGILPLELTYTGAMTYADDGLYRYFTLTSSGTLSLNREFTGDIWICGGGGGGGAGAGSSSRPAGGGGGGGGHFAQSTGQLVQNSVVVTIGAQAANSSFGSLLSANAGSAGEAGSRDRGGYGGDGGSGGGGGAGRAVAADGGAGGGVTTIPFSDSHFTAYPCAGGGGGGSTIGSYLEGGNGGSNGSNGLAGSTSGATSSGGATGGGTGGIANTDPTAATYYGGGGGGGKGYSSGAGSNGYQGVCFIRIPLKEFTA